MRVSIISKDDSTSKSRRQFQQYIFRHSLQSGITSRGHSARTRIWSWAITGQVKWAISGKRCWGDIHEP